MMFLKWQIDSCIPMKTVSSTIILQIENFSKYFSFLLEKRIMNGEFCINVFKKMLCRDVRCVVMGFAVPLHDLQNELRKPRKNLYFTL